MQRFACPSCSRTAVGSAARYVIRAALIVAVTLAAAPADAASACPAVDAAWLQSTATGTYLNYGYTLDGTIPPGVRPNKEATPFSAAGVATLVGTSVVSNSGGSTITGFVVSGTETQNVGGTVTTLSFGGTQDSVFTLDTTTCTGTLTRVFVNGPTVTWQIVAVDGGDTLRFMDTGANPSVRTGALQRMR